MDSLLWLLPLALLWPAIWVIRVLYVTRLLCGMKIGREVVTGLPMGTVPPHLCEASLTLLEELQALGYYPRQGMYSEMACSPAFFNALIECTREGDPVRIEIVPHAEAAKAGHCYLVVSSTHADGTELVSSQWQEEALLPPVPGLRLHVEPGLPIGDLLQLHRQRMQELAAPVELDAIQAVARRQQLWDGLWAAVCKDPGFFRESEEVVRFRFVPAFRRALVVLRAHKQQKALLKSKGLQFVATPLPEETQLEFDLISYRRLRAIKSGRLSFAAKTAVMIGSCLLFALALGWQFSFSFAAVLLAALIFHECGHLVGMWLFGFKDTQLLFLPFLGGAAVGFDDKVIAPWKHLVILLLGPLPGLFLAMAGLLFLESPPEWLHQACVVTLSLNLFNLLPILPLDGGQIVDYSLTHRFPRLHAVFYLLSCLGMLLVGYFMGNTGVLMGLAVVMLLQVPFKWRSAGMVGELRRELPASPDEETALRALLRRLRTAPLGKSDWVQRLQLAPALMHTLRLPRAGWGTIVFACLALSSPLWLGLGSYVVIGNLQADRQIAAAKEKARPLFLDTPVTPSPGDAGNGALRLLELKASLERLSLGRFGKASPGQAEAPTSREAERAALLAGLLEVSRAEHFRMPAPKEDPKDPLASLALWKGQITLVLSKEAERQLKNRQPAKALELAVALLRLGRLMREDPVFWTWMLDNQCLASGLDLLERALSDGAPLDEQAVAVLADLLDEPSYLAFSTRALPEEIYHNALRLDGQDLGSGEEGDLLAVLSLAGRLIPTYRRLVAEQIESAIQVRECLAQVPTVGYAKAKWDVTGKEGLPVWQLGQFTTLVARLRMAQAGVAIAHEMQVSDTPPGTFADMKLYSLTAIHNPLGGPDLEWHKEEGAEYLRFPAQPKHEEWEEEEPLSWRLPQVPGTEQPSS